jgi:hypothetical protein
MKKGASFGSFLGFIILFSLAMAVLKFVIIGLAILLVIVIIYGWIVAPREMMGMMVISTLLYILQQHTIIGLLLIGFLIYAGIKTHKPKRTVSQQKPPPLLSKPPD